MIRNTDGERYHSEGNSTAGVDPTAQANSVEYRRVEERVMGINPVTKKPTFYLRTRYEAVNKERIAGVIGLGATNKFNTLGNRRAGVSPEQRQMREIFGQNPIQLKLYGIYGNEINLPTGHEDRGRLVNIDDVALAYDTTTQDILARADQADETLSCEGFYSNVIHAAQSELAGAAYKASGAAATFGLNASRLGVYLNEALEHFDMSIHELRLAANQDRDGLEHDQVQ